MRAVLLLVALAAVGCRAPGKAAERATASSATTGGAVALGNLDSQIAGLESVLVRRPSDAAARDGLVSALLARAAWRGRLADLFRADELARPACAEDDADALLTCASTHLALHRFSRAASLLDRVDALDPRHRTRAARITLLQATGRLAEARALADELVSVHPDLDALGVRGALALDPSASLGFYARARLTYRNSSPFPVAWLDLLEGQARERLGTPDLARRLYADAVHRVPGYPQATGKLAALEDDPEAAADLLAPVVTASDDPEYESQLAQIELILRRFDDARRHREEARTRYEALLARAPEAFADHAARFFLDVAGDAPRALALAKMNAVNRPTTEAMDLVTRAERACGTAPEAAAR